MLTVYIRKFQVENFLNFVLGEFGVIYKALLRLKGQANEEPVAVKTLKGKY